MSESGEGALGLRADVGLWAFGGAKIKDLEWKKAKILENSPENA